MTPRMFLQVLILDLLDVSYPCWDLSKSMFAQRGFGDVGTRPCFLCLFRTSVEIHVLMLGLFKFF